MPRYDFQCKDCENIFELSLSLKERESECAKKKCSKCNSLNVVQLMTFNGGILSKGPSKCAEMPSCASGACPAMGGGGCAGGTCFQ